VYGKGLDLLQRPRMVVTYEDSVYYGPKCEVIDDHLMVCRSPGLEELPAHRVSFYSPLHFNLNFSVLR
jgi:hypothetical protein